MKTRPIVLLSLLCLIAAGCSSTKLTGTAYSVTYRPSESDLRSQLGGRNVSLINSRSGTVIAMAQYDHAGKAYRFTLPLLANLAQETNVCLALRSFNGRTVQLREVGRGDDGYDFRNPLWEKEIKRGAKLAQLRAEMGKHEDAQTLAKAELEIIETKYGANVAHARAPCPLLTSTQASPKPAVALDEAEAKRLAPGLCAAKWSAQLGGGAESLFKDASLQADWAARAADEALASAFGGLSLTLSAADLDLVRAAMTEGTLDVRHQRGIAVFKKQHAQCQLHVVDASQSALRAWQTQTERAREAPLLAQKRCQSDVMKVPPLEEKLAQARAEHARLAEIAKALEREEASATDTETLDSHKCAL